MQPFNKYRMSSSELEVKLSLFKFCLLFKGHWQQKMSTFHIKVYDLNRQDVAVWRHDNARNTF